LRKVIIAVLLSMLLFGSIYFIELNICKLSYRKNKYEAEEILRIAHNLVDNQSRKNENVSINNDSSTSNVLNNNKETKMNKSENDIIGILYIEKLDIEAPVKEGTTQEVMKTSIGHFPESDYWNGNVSLASHNSGTSMHYFQDIHTLNINDQIKYKTQFGEKVYKVQSIDKINDTDWSKVVKNDSYEKQKNTITLITCINGQPDYRLCVRGVEV